MVEFDFPRQTRPAAGRRLFDTSDGDTPNILQPIRMVSYDTAEKAHYAGRPEVAQPKLERCRQRLLAGDFPEIPDSLRNYLVDKLGPQAAARHIGAAEQASVQFDLLLRDRLTNPDGSQRRVATIPTGEIVDRYGRMLAYLAPWFTGAASDPLPPRDDPRRRTFNLDMVAAGWGASFLLYPSLPNNFDLNLLLDEARLAWTQRRGAWATYTRKLLLGYEYRLAIKLGTITTPSQAIGEAFQRVCVDLRSMRLRGLFDWARVPPPERLWVWKDDLPQATVDLGIVT